MIIFDRVNLIVYNFIPFVSEYAKVSVKIIGEKRSS